MSAHSLLTTLVILGALLAAPARAGTWQALNHQPPFAASTMFLLTDSTVLCQKSGDLKWWKLTPDVSGSYVNGTWSKVAEAHYDRLYYASGVFADGRVIVSGGEYSSFGSEINKTEIYDPVANTWTEIAAPFANVGDAPCVILPDGRFLIGSIFDNRTAIYDPEADTWTGGPRKKNAQSTEETWVLMADGTVVNPDCVGHPNSEKYVTSTNKWVNIGATPVDLVEAASLEIGPGLTLPDGRAFFMGATPTCALYTSPPNPSDPGTWVAGPVPPLVGGQTVGAKDAPCALLPSGRVLLALGPVNGVGGDFLSPTYFFECDGGGFTRVADPPNSGGPPYIGRMLLLPTGEVLFANGGTTVYAYKATGGPDPSWRPTITSVPTSIAQTRSYALEGTQLNGLSQAAAYGDEAGVATNYPLVRVKNLATSHVFYCRTFDHSTMAVGPGSALVSTRFQVPASAEIGQGELVVVANGIASDPVLVTVVAPDSCPDPVHYGLPTPGSGGVTPTITWSGGVPYLGNPDFHLKGDLLYGGQTGFLFVGFTKITVNLGQGAYLNVAPPWVVLPFPVPGLPFPGFGSIDLNVPIYPDPALAGVHFYSQFMCFDPGGPLGLTGTDGLDSLICN
ncbi:MAG: hypothetical protein U1E76_14655 [Planctomycetota bacterium]